MTPEQRQEIARLRSLNLAPKQIARQLGLRPAEVTVVLRNQALAATTQGKGKALPPVKQCLINERAAQHLLDRPQQQGLFGQKNTDGGDDDGGGGLAQIIVTRLDRSQYLVNSYLVDYWCLGVKDTFGPRKMDRTKYSQFRNRVRQQFSQDLRDITLEQAQSIIFGAVDYAARFELKPHRDFECSQLQLGVRPETLVEIEFGRDGKPFYMSGPYDNPNKILEKLQKHAGEGNFHFMSHIP